jgi:hypothetical protein
MKLNIRFTSDTTPNLPGIFEVRKYGDPFMVAKMGLDTKILGTSNFQNVDLFTPKDGFKSVSVFQKLSKTELDYLMSIQPVDGGTFNSKMQFLCGERIGVPSRPYWTRNGTWQELSNGDTNITFEFGTMVFGGQKIKVETDANNLPKVYYFDTRYQSESDTQIRPIAFYKLLGMRRSDMGKYTHQSHPWFIQQCTWASYSENNYKTQWMGGTVYHPVWSPYDWNTNNGSNALYIAREFLVGL